MRRKGAFLLAAAAAASLVAAALAALFLWNDLGASEITPSGWAALVLGALFTFLLAALLVSLMLYSSHKGYDDGRQE